MRLALGADAGRIAVRITGGTDVRSSGIGHGGPTLSSSATCMLASHLVIVDSWIRRGLSTLPDELVSAETYYAYGSAWTAFLADDEVGADFTTLQMRLTNDAAGLLAQGFCGTPAPASIDVQCILAGDIARALHGTVGHTSASDDA